MIQNMMEYLKPPYLLTKHCFPRIQFPFANWTSKLNSLSILPNGRAFLSNIHRRIARHYCVSIDKRLEVLHPQAAQLPSTHKLCKLNVETS